MPACRTEGDAYENEGRRVPRVPPECRLRIAIGRVIRHIESQNGVCRAIFRSSGTELLPVRAARHRQVGLDATSLRGRCAHRPAPAGHPAALPGAPRPPVRPGPRPARRAGDRHRRGAARPGTAQRRPCPHRRAARLAVRADRVERTQAQARRRRSHGGPGRGADHASFHGSGAGRRVRHALGPAARAAAAGAGRGRPGRHAGGLHRGVRARRGAGGGAGAGPGPVLPVP